MAKKLRLLSASLIFMTVALWTTTPVTAWETLVEKGKNSWLSLYQKHIDSEGVAEHTELADIALNRLGVGKLFSRNGTADFRVVDLNASYYRFDAMSGLVKEGDNADTPLEERRLPPPAYFSGVPDYSFTIYDWLNKNELCPPGTPAQTCHVYFGGWLGNLNSTHFGSQAEGMYFQFHGLAMFLARRASKFHTQIRNAGGKERDAYKDWVREAELEALAYEGYAQHFLQDRWSVGHMWERWNAGGYNQLPRKDMAVNMAIGAISGLIHGSEAVVGKVNKLGKKIGDYGNDLDALDALDISGDSMAARLARQLKSMAGGAAAEVSRQFKAANPADPMSSPWIRDGEALPSVWRHAVTADKGLYYGIGDDRLADMKDKKFGKEYPQIGKDYDIDVQHQFDEFMTCSMAGWAEVIREFGNFGGLYGAWQARLNDGVPAFDIRKHRACWDMWATNRAVYLGLTNHNSLNASVVSRLSWAVDTYTSIKKVMNLDGFPRKDVTRMVTETELDMLDQPAGTDLASGGLRSILGVGTGDEYNYTPAYAETPMFNKFDLFAANGMDKATIYGVFNRAHSDQMCKDIPKLLKELRGEEGSRKLALCEYLGNFAYESTLKDYDGEQKEHRKYEDVKIKGLCAVRGEGMSSREAMPRFIDQGYVPFGENGKPEDKSKSGMGPQSIWNWCRETPILLLDEKPELRDDNIVAEIYLDEDTLALKAENLGELEGKLLALKDGKWVSLGSTLRWQENYILIKLDLDDSWEDDIKGDYKDYRLKVIARDAKEGQGLFRLRIKKKEKIEPEPIQLLGFGPCHIPLDIEKFPVVDFTGAISGWDQLTPSRMTQLKEATEPFWTMAADLMDREADCIDASRIKVVDPKYDRVSGEPIFPDAGDYPPIIYDKDGFINYVGSFQLRNEIPYFKIIWGAIDAAFYGNHSRGLRVMARYFRHRPDKLQELTDQAQDLLDKAGDTEREEDAKAYKDYRQKIYEDVYRDYTLAPRYLAYLGTGLNRWAMAEQQLITKIIPATEQARQGRKASLLVDGCYLFIPPEGQFLQFPVSLAATTTAFSMMYADSGWVRNAGGEMLFGAGKTLFMGLAHASDDNPDMLWSTPRRQQQQQGWQLRLDPDSLGSLNSSCGSSISTVQKMSSFEFLYGDRYDDLMGMGALYNELYLKDEGKWVGDKEERFTCLRCAALERALNIYKVRRIAEYNNLGDELISATNSGMAIRGTATIPFIKTRIKQLEKQLEGCRNRCEMPDFALPDTKVTAFQQIKQSLPPPQKMPEFSPVKADKQPTLLLPPPDDPE